MAADRTMAPPRLGGFTYEARLGSGGFADVYLYRQELLNRQVAVKVLRSTVDDQTTQLDFVAEAKLMAAVSTHPYIVSIFDADVAEDGRPFIVMEYYPHPHYGLRMKPSGLAQAEVLRVGVQLASAVETAHRAGILHRDIKPANILSSEYDRPGLTDFGISGARGDGTADVSLGFSTAYAPPEVLLDQSPGDERSDVYALAATLYALLAGRSPFELPGLDSSRASLTKRILSDPVPPTGKQAMAGPLDHLLRLALAKDPGSRPQTAVAFARALQQVQQELRLDPTPLELREAARPSAPDRSDPTDQDGTRLGGMQVVDPSGPASTRPHPGRAAPSSSGVIELVPKRIEPGAISEVRPFGTGDLGLRDAEDPTTIHRPPTPGVPPSPPPSAGAPAPRRKALVGGALGVGVLALAAVVALQSSGGREPETEPEMPSQSGPGLIVLTNPEPPTDVEVVVADGEARVSWNAAGSDAEYFVVTRNARADDEESVQADASPAVLSGIDTDEQVCVEVVAVREGQLSEPSPVMCSS